MLLTERALHQHQHLLTGLPRWFFLLLPLPCLVLLSPAQAWVLHIIPAPGSHPPHTHHHPSDLPNLSGVCTVPSTRWPLLCFGLVPPLAHTAVIPAPPPPWVVEGTGCGWIWSGGLGSEAGVCFFPYDSVSAASGSCIPSPAHVLSPIRAFAPTVSAAWKTPSPSSSSGLSVLSSPVLPLPARSLSYLSPCSPRMALRWRFLRVLYFSVYVSPGSVLLKC